MRDFRDAKAMAQTLRDALKVKSIPLTHSESLELIAKTLGVHDWNVLAAAIQSSQPMSAEPRKPTDGDPVIIPLVPLRDIVVFPQMVVPLFVGREKTRRAAETALAADGRIFAVTQRRAADDEPGLTDLYTVGVIAKVIHRVSLGDGTIKLIISGTERGTVVKPVAPGSWLPRSHRCCKSAPTLPRKAWRWRAGCSTHTKRMPTFPQSRCKAI
jgi:hypothetical protein